MIMGIIEGKMKWVKSGVNYP